MDLAYPIRNVDRTIGARLSGEITARYGDAGLPDGTINVRLSGTAGQSFGAWLTPGIALRLKGPANDYVGKGMGGGLISIAPPRGPSIPHAAGNAVLYGATGGRIFISGRVGQRFAVRNSGAVAVAEGCSDHGCEYMTGGVVVILGEAGRNFAAGMTGGTASRPPSIRQRDRSAARPRGGALRRYFAPDRLRSNRRRDRQFQRFLGDLRGRAIGEKVAHRPDGGAPATRMRQALAGQKESRLFQVLHDLGHEPTAQAPVDDPVVIGER